MPKGWFAFVIALGFAVSVFAQAPQTRPAGDIRVEKTGDAWIITGESRTVRLNPDFSMTVIAGPATWKMLPSAGDDLSVESAGKRANFRLLDAGKIDVAPYADGTRTGLRIELSGFNQIDLNLRLFICLEAVTDDLICEVVATENTAKIKQVLWPKGFDPSCFDRTVVPYMQGMLLPRDWSKKVVLYDALSYGRGLYMPWWGHEQKSSGVAVILETPDDAGCRFEHPAGGPTRIAPRLVHSLGKLAYPRRVRMSFLDNGNYVDLAKRYRRYVMETGHFLSLKAKIARTPLVGNVVGSPVVHTSILEHIQPDSSYYNKKNPAANHQLVTFDARADQLRKLAAKGVGRAYVHLDGWGLRGYDNLHPDILPPCPEAGGWDGMRRFADACDQVGYIFAVHDQYRDYYLDAASYSDKLTIIDEHGGRPGGSTWFGGKQSILCPRFAPGHVAKNHRQILAQGVKLRGAYLDVFAVVPPDECYNPDHPATRTDCLRLRSQCLDFIAATEGVVSSEEPADWAIPHIALVHHAPFALDPGPGGGSSYGIPVPLFTLVYHDALIVPWYLDKGGWGIARDDWAYLWGLACAGIPYVSMNPSDDELVKVRAMCALHRRVGLLEMTRHEILDDAGRKHRTTFADGTTVTIDHSANTYEISPPLAAAELEAALRPRLLAN